MSHGWLENLLWPKVNLLKICDELPHKARHSSISIADNSTYVTIVDAAVQLQTLTLVGPQDSEGRPKPVYEGEAATFTIRVAPPTRKPIQLVLNTHDGTATGSPDGHWRPIRDDSRSSLRWVRCGTTDCDYQIKSNVDFTIDPGTNNCGTSDTPAQCVQVSVPVYKEDVNDSPEQFDLSINLKLRQNYRHRGGRNQDPTATTTRATVTTSTTSTTTSTSTSTTTTPATSTSPSPILIANNRATATIREAGEKPSPASSLIGFYDAEFYDIESKSVREPAAGSRSVVLDVRLKKALTKSLTLRYYTDECLVFERVRDNQGNDVCPLGKMGTATEGIDYQNAQGSITFAAGQTHRTISVRILADRIVDGNESFSLKLVATGPNCTKLQEADPLLTQTQCASLDRTTINIIDADTLTLGFADAWGEFKRPTTIYLNGVSTTYPNGVYSFREGKCTSVDVENNRARNNNGRIVGWRDARGCTSSSDRLESMYIAALPSSNITSRNISVRLTSQPRSASLGEDYSFAQSAPEEATAWWRFGALSSNLLGINDLRLKGNDRIEADEQFQVFIHTRPRAGDTLQVYSAHRQGLPVVIENNDFAEIDIQYARVATGSSCASATGYKGVVGNMDFFKNYRLCVRAACNRNNKLMQQGKKVRLSLKARPTGSRLSAAEFGSMSFTEAQCNLSSSDVGQSTYASGTYMQYASYDIDNTGRGRDIFISTSTASDALSWQAVSYSDRSAYANLSSGLRQSECRYDGGTWTASMCTKMRPRQSYFKRINLLSEDSDGPTMELAYMGNIKFDTSASPQASDCSQALHEHDASSASHGVHDASLLRISEPDTDGKSSYACFKPTIRAPDADDFTTASGRALTSCSGAGSLRVAARSWADKDSHPPVFNANVGETDYSLHGTPDGTSVAGYDAAQTYSINWNFANGDCTANPIAVATAKVAHDGEPDAQHRGFELSITNTGRLPLRSNAGNPYKFYIPSDLYGADEPTRAPLRIALQPLGFAAQNSPQDCSLPSGGTTLAGYKIGRSMCYEAQLQKRMRANGSWQKVVKPAQPGDPNPDAALIQRLTADIRLRINTSNTDVQAPHLPATSEHYKLHTPAGGILTLTAGQVVSQKFSIEFLPAPPPPVGSGDRKFKLSISELGVPHGVDDLTIDPTARDVVIRNQTRDPALNLVALGYADRASDCSNDNGEFETITSPNVDHRVLEFSAAEKTARAATVDEGKFVCLQAEYLKYMRPITNPPSSQQAQPCGTGLSVDANGYCWALVTPDSSFSFQLDDTNLERVTNYARVDSADYEALSSPWSIADNKFKSSIFAVQINKNDDDLTASLGEALKLKLKATSDDLTHFLSNRSFVVQIPYNTDASNSGEAGHDGNELPKPVVASSMWLSHLSSDAPVVKLEFRGHTPLAAGDTQDQYKIQMCAVAASAPPAAPAEPQEGDDCWTTGENNGLICTDVAAGDPTADDNRTKLVQIGSVRATANTAPYKFACAVEAEELADGKYYFFRVQDVGRTGDSDDMSFAVSQPVSPVPSPEPFALQVRKVERSGLGIQLSWPCPPSEQRKWGCATSANPQVLSVSDAIKNNSVGNDIVEYQVYRCKMRDTNRNGTYMQFSKSGQKTRHTSGRSVPYEDTYDDTDDMPCEDLADGWPAVGWVNFKIAHPTDADNYEAYPNYDGYNPDVKAEKDHIEKLVWGDMRFGAYANAGASIETAASRTAAGQLKANTSFETVGGKIIFTDRSDITHGRYKYRVRAVSKSGTFTDVYCDGTGDPNTAAGMEARLDTTLANCTNMTRMHANVRPFHIPLGLVAKPLPAPTDLEVRTLVSKKTDSSRELGYNFDYNLIRLNWKGHKQEVDNNNNNRYVYAPQFCSNASADAECNSWTDACQQAHKLDDAAKFNKIRSDFYLPEGVLPPPDSLKSKVLHTGTAVNGEFQFICVLQRPADPSSFYRFRVGLSEAAHGTIEQRYDRIGKGGSSDWSSVSSAVQPSHNNNVQTLNSGDAKIKKDTSGASKKVVLQWPCPAAAKRRWTCAGATPSAGTAPEGEQTLSTSSIETVDGKFTTPLVHGDQNRVGWYKVCWSNPATGKEADKGCTQKVSTENGKLQAEILSATAGAEGTSLTTGQSYVFKLYSVNEIGYHNTAITQCGSHSGSVLIDTFAGCVGSSTGLMAP